MKRFRDRPLGAKLVWVTLVTSGVTLLLACGAFVAYEVSSYREDMLRTVSTQAEIVGYNATSALVFDDRQSAVSTLEALRAEPAVLEAALYTKSGARFAWYAREMANPSLPGRIEPPASGYRLEGRRLIVLRAIESQGEPVGSLQIVADLGAIDARLLRYLEIAALVFVVTIGAAIVISSGTQRIVSEPILGLVETARRVSAEKDYSLRARPAGNDEVGLLVRSFNEMLEQIQQRDAALERARDEAEAGNRAKDEFLATVSHELRTPLTPIFSWVNLLKSGRLDQVGHRRALDGIDRNAKAQAQLVADLLDVSRIISGKLRLDIRTVEVAPLLEAAIESTRPAADAKQITLESPPPTTWTVAADPDRLQQVFWNLLSNAVKFTPAGGRVQVSATADSGRLSVRVSDSGQGIKPDFLPQVFDRFRQADGSTTRAHGGLGLGLAIVKSIVELHGGTVRAESDGEGLGAHFVVELALARQGPLLARGTAAAGSASADHLLPPCALAAVRILVVDDEPDTLETLRDTLVQCGATVRTAVSVGEALEIIGGWLPDVLVSDLGMPGEDGFDLIQRLRTWSAASGGDVPALALTAYARTEDRLKALAAGYQMHLAKPVEPAHLVSVVGKLAEWSGRRTAG